MANRVMNQTEKLSLANSDDFKEKCKQAIRDYAVFAAPLDGSGLSTEADRVKWAKDRIHSVKILKNPIIQDDGTTVAWFFLNGAKGKVYDIQANPETAANLIALWVAANSFEEFVGEYFKSKNDEIDMSFNGAN